MDGDDAGGGRRGLRAAPSPRLFEALRDRYGIEGSEGARDLGGSSSLNLLVVCGAVCYVVRAYRPYVTMARLDDMQRVRRHLAAGGIPCSQVVPTRDGASWIVFENRLVEVERYVERDAEMDSPERLRAGLPLLGRIHTRLRGVTVSAEGKTPRFANHIEPRDVLARTAQGTERIRGWNPSSDEQRLADAADELAQQLHAAERAFVPLLPRQLTHGDYWDNNVLFRTGNVVLVADFDFVGERARSDDLALTLFYAIAAFFAEPADSITDGGLQSLRALVDAYDSGLDEKLSSAERTALPLAIARQPLWSFGGWIALLDDEEHARQHAAGMHGEVARSLQIVREVEKWQTAFA